MPMPLDTLKTLQDFDITGDGAAWAQQQQDGNDTRQQQQQRPIESHGQQPAQPLHHLDPTAAPHSAPLHAHPSEQPHSTMPSFYPPLLDQHFALDADSTLPIDPGLLDARFDHPAASGHAGGGAPGFHQGHHHHFAATQPVPSVNMDNSLKVSPTTFTQYTDPPAQQLQPGISSFEPMISTAWSMDGSLPSTSTSRGPTMSSSMSVPSNSTPASSKSPGSPGKVGAAGISSQPPSAGRDPSVTGYSGMQQLEQPRAHDEPGSNKKRRQTVGPKATARPSTEKLRSHRNNSSPGFSTPQAPIAPAPIAMVGTGDDNSRKFNTGKGSGISSSDSHETKTTKTTTTTTTTAASSNSPSRPSRPAAAAAPTTTTTTTTTAAAVNAPAPGQPPDPRARNREAANRCRAKSKVAVAELEATERVLGSEHEHLTRTARSLRDEVIALKTELLAHGNCGDELIQQYLTNSARMVGSGAGGTIGGAAGITTTGTRPTTMATTAAGGGGGTLFQGMPHLPLQQPPGPSLGGGGAGGIVGSSSRPVPSVSPPRGLPAILPSTLPSAPGAGPTTTSSTTITTARGRGRVGGGRKP